MIIWNKDCVLILNSKRVLALIEISTEDIIISQEKRKFNGLVSDGFEQYVRISIDELKEVIPKKELLNGNTITLVTDRGNISLIFKEKPNDIKKEIEITLSHKKKIKKKSRF